MPVVQSKHSLRAEESQLSQPQHSCIYLVHLAMPSTRKEHIQAFKSEGKAKESCTGLFCLTTLLCVLGKVNLKSAPSGNLVKLKGRSKCCCLSAEAVLFLHLFFSVRADYNHGFRLDWLHSSSLLRRRLSRHLHLQQQLHPHSQHQYISAANQEIKAGDKFFRTSDLQQQSLMMGCCSLCISQQLCTKTPGEQSRTQLPSPGLGFIEDLPLQPNQKKLSEHGSILFQIFLCLDPEHAHQMMYQNKRNNASRRRNYCCIKVVHLWVLAKTTEESLELCEITCLSGCGMCVYIANIIPAYPRISYCPLYA
nr:hypothetical protein Iba_chr14aCG22630 [Ipomoea batatas]